MTGRWNSQCCWLISGTIMYSNLFGCTILAVIYCTRARGGAVYPRLLLLSLTASALRFRALLPRFVGAATGLRHADAGRRPVETLHMVTVEDIIDAG
jgi:hypothetical protein